MLSHICRNSCMLILDNPILLLRKKVSLAFGPYAFQAVCCEQLTSPAGTEGMCFQAKQNIPRIKCRSSKFKAWEDSGSWATGSPTAAQHRTSKNLQTLQISDFTKATALWLHPDGWCLGGVRWMQKADKGVESLCGFPLETALFFRKAICPAPAPGIKEWLSCPPRALRALSSLWLPVSSHSLPAELKYSFHTDSTRRLLPWEQTENTSDYHK